MMKTHFLLMMMEPCYQMRSLRCPVRRCLLQLPSIPLLPNLPLHMHSIQAHR